MFLKLFPPFSLWNPHFSNTPPPSSPIHMKTSAVFALPASHSRSQPINAYLPSELHSSAFHAFIRTIRLLPLNRPPIFDTIDGFIHSLFLYVLHPDFTRYIITPHCSIFQIPVGDHRSSTSVPDWAPLHPFFKDQGPSPPPNKNHHPLYPLPDHLGSLSPGFLRLNLT